jgi:hypothetical protein
MEKDYLFTNRCVMTGSLNLEIEQYNFWTKRQKWLVTFCFLMFTAFCVLFVYAGKTFDAVLSASLAAIILFFFWDLPRSKSKSKRGFRWLCEQEHTDRPENLLFFSEEAFTEKCVATKGQITFPYSSVKAYDELKHVILLTAVSPQGGPDLTLAISKNGFVQGKPDDFPSFIARKCPGINRNRE